MRSKYSVLFFIVSLIFHTVQYAESETWQLPSAVQDSGKLSELDRVFIKKFKLEGNTAFSTDQLSKLFSSFENREINAEELQEVRQKLTKYYVINGYVNSGVIIPDQKMDNGIVILKIIEGKMTSLKITGNRRLKKSYIRKRIERGEEFKAVPLNIHVVQKHLKLLKQDPRIKTVNASIKPGLKRGTAILKADIDETRPWYAGIEVNNYNPPSLGKYQGKFRYGHMNLTGWGDSIDMEYRIAKGIDDYKLRYTVPVSARDTVIGFDIKKVKSTIVSRKFDILDISSETNSWELFIRHPFYKSLSTEFTMGFSFGKNKNKTFLLDLPFSFTRSADNRTNVAVFRFTQKIVLRNKKQVIAVFSSLNHGIDALDSTVLNFEPDGEFYSWLGQMQWVRSIGFLDSKVGMHMNFQISDNPLLPSEMFSTGGVKTVRGYRENHMTTDCGFNFGLEWHIPVGTIKLPLISRAKRSGKITAIPFFDYGKSWNKYDPDPDPENIYSVGLGFKWNMGKLLTAEIFWGYALEDVKITDEHNLQDNGVHFLIKSSF